METGSKGADGVLLSGQVADGVMDALREHVAAAKQVTSERDSLASEILALRSAVRSSDEPGAAEILPLKAALAQRDRRIRELMVEADEVAILRAEKSALEAQVDEQQRTIDALIAQIEALRARVLRTAPPSTASADP